MTLTATALEILSATESGSVENADQPLRNLCALLTTDLDPEEISSALPILDAARQAAYARRARVVQSLQQLEQSVSYAAFADESQMSWELVG